MTLAGSVTLRRVWLWLTLALFCGWIAWLGHLAFTKPVVLERAQFLVADVVVLGQVDDLKANQVTVRQVAWSHDPGAPAPKEGETLTVTNLPECKQDWRGPEQYILPLLRTGETYEVADPTGLTEAQRAAYVNQQKKWVPSDSPGYDVYDPDTKAVRPPRIYPVTHATLAQLWQMHPKP
jgi:hypothetical protein